MAIFKTAWRVMERSVTLSIVSAIGAIYVECEQRADSAITVRGVRACEKFREFALS